MGFLCSLRDVTCRLCTKCAGPWLLRIRRAVDRSDAMSCDVIIDLQEKEQSSEGEVLCKVEEVGNARYHNHRDWLTPIH